MEAAIRIRRAEEDDALALSVLAEAAFRAAFAEATTPANMLMHCAATYGQVLQIAEIRELSRETWVAELDCRLIAYVQLRCDAALPMIPGERAAEIQRFYVDISHHGAGVAHQLMAHILARAEATGFAVLWLGVSIENGDLKSLGSTPSCWATIRNLTC